MGFLRRIAAPILVRISALGNQQFGLAIIDAITPGLRTGAAQKTLGTPGSSDLISFSLHLRDKARMVIASPVHLQRTH
jgi:hypothetical protein